MTSPAAIVFLGGFECSTHRRADGQRLDLIASSGHDRLAYTDYERLAGAGIRAVRDGVRWHLIEQTPGIHDGSTLHRLLHAAKRVGTQVIWDLCHYGYPDFLDIWSDEFVRAFARFAGQAAQVIKDSRCDSSPVFLPDQGEMSYWAWAGAEVGRINPAACGRGAELKRQLVRATIAAIVAIR